MASLTGRVFGHYQILESIGRGGMATVYRALDRKADREVAIKFISPAVAQSEEFLRRFRREVKVVARLDHPHILSVLDYGEEQGYAYLVMPMMEGGSLADRMQERAVSLQEGGKVLGQVAQALSYAHERGLIHRDVKPSNILLDQRGNAQLADFGLARPVEESLNLTGPGVIGTPAYMAPEQIQGGKVDARCDQYALGVLLFQLSTGTLPFEADTPIAYLLKHVKEEFPAARSRNPNVPQTIDRMISRATAKDPDLRFESVAAMNEALQASLAHVLDPLTNRAPTVDLPSTTRRLPLTRRRRRALLTVGGILGALVLVLGVPVFASGLVGLLEQAQSPAEGSAADLSAPQLTAQAATIEAMSTALADSGGSAMTGSEIETAVVQTLTAGDTDPAGQDASASDFASGATTPHQTPSPTPEASVQALSSGTPGTTATPPPASTTTVPPTLPPGVTPSKTPTPTASATPSRTATPSPSPTRTPTASPTATRTPTPTATLAATPVPTATQDPCSSLALGGFGSSDDRVWWTLSNASSSTMTITRLVLDWPVTNGTLERIRFDSSSIWNGTDDAPPSDISSGWTGNRAIEGAVSKDLVFEFTGQAAGSGYGVEVHLGASCQKSSGG